MESKIQPILCCVGAAVAGRPTQFLMERAFEAARCDWRVITVEVQPENFQAALDGMQAMAFTALRFFPELQTLAASLMVEQNAVSPQAITSAMRQRSNEAEERWDCWDNQGFGMLDVIAGVGPASSMLIWLHGRSRLTQSLSDAMQSHGFQPLQVIWSDAEVAADSAEPTLHSTPLTEVLPKLKDALNSTNPITQLVVVGEGLAEHLPLIGELEVGAEVQLVLATNQMLTRQQVNDSWKSGKVRIITENDQLIAAEAYDFRRWTGQPADMDLLRDAYDEYADF